MIRAATMATVLLTATFVVFMPTPAAQLPDPGVDVDVDLIGDVGLDNGTVAINGTSDTGIIIDPAVNASVPHVGSSASFSFDLPLYDGPGFRFLKADGNARDGVTIRVQWQDATGRAQPFPAYDGQRAILEMKNPSRVLTPPVQALEASGSVAVFHIPYGDLVDGQETSWTLTARAPGDDISALGSSASIGHQYKQDGRVAHIKIGDADLDGRPDDIDNCKDVPNPDQANLDGDMHGDACDADMDDDGASNEEERIARSDPRDPDSTPDDPDADGYNNTSEHEAGSDPYDAASTPDDPDADGFTNAQEAAAGSDPRHAASTPHDIDADGTPNEADLCPEHADDQSDGDSDGIGDACDDRPQDGPTGDADDDGVLNKDDNCRTRHNPDQRDLDGDGRGDACDSDIDGDGHPRGTDAFPEDPSEWSDHDEDGVGDNADQDDDNDGLSDEGEASIGTDPRDPDSDNDRLGDLEEVSRGSNPRDPYDPPYTASEVSVAATSQGALIEWTGSSDARVDHYAIWHRSPLRLVGTVDANGEIRHQITDTMPGEGDHLYSVQAVLEGQSDRFVWLASSNALVFGSDLLVAQAAPDGQEVAAPTLAPGSDADDVAIAPSQESPGPAVVVLLVAVLWLARRR